MRVQADESPQLLSTDPVSNRRFTVANGVIVAHTGTHPNGVDADHSELGAITVQLANTNCPTDVLDTPNAGGAYKVWATPVADFVGNAAQVDNECGSGCFHGFVPSKSKTDNFKVKNGTSTFCLTLKKEASMDGAPFAPRANWTFYVIDTLGSTNLHNTGADGSVQVCGLPAGTYTAGEAEDANVYAVFLNGVPAPKLPTVNVTWVAGQPEPVVLFQNNENGVN